VGVRGERCEYDHTAQELDIGKMMSFSSPGRKTDSPTASPVKTGIPTTTATPATAATAASNAPTNGNNRNAMFWRLVEVGGL